MEFVEMLENKRCRYIVACANRLYVYFLFMILVLSSVSANCPPCSSDDMVTTKSVCQEKGAFLQDSENTKNSTIVCAALHDLLQCVAENIPQCLDTISAEYDIYTYKPWDCVFTPNHVTRYQEIVLAGCSDNKTSITPLESRDKFSYEMVQQNSTSSGISTNKHDYFIGISTLTNLIIFIQLSIFGAIL